MGIPAGMGADLAPDTQGFTHAIAYSVLCSTGGPCAWGSAALWDSGDKISSLLMAH